MKINVLDWRSNRIEIDLPDKEIKTILVTVLSGDETGVVTFTDGDTVCFDASGCRFMDFYDGSYCVEGEAIAKWIADGEEGISVYGRLEKYGGLPCRPTNSKIAATPRKRMPTSSTMPGLRAIMP